MTETTAIRFTAVRDGLCFSKPGQPFFAIEKMDFEMGWTLKEEGAFAGTFNTLKAAKAAAHVGVAAEFEAREKASSDAFWAAEAQAFEHQPGEVIATVLDDSGTGGIVRAAFPLGCMVTFPLEARTLAGTTTVITETGKVVGPKETRRGVEHQSVCLSPTMTCWVPVEDMTIISPDDSGWVLDGWNGWTTVADAKAALDAEHDHLTRVGDGELADRIISRINRLTELLAEKTVTCAHCPLDEDAECDPDACGIDKTGIAIDEPEPEDVGSEGTISTEEETTMNTAFNIVASDSTVLGALVLPGEGWSLQQLTVHVLFNSVIAIRDQWAGTSVSETTQEPGVWSNESGWKMVAGVNVFGLAEDKPSILVTEHLDGTGHVIARKPFDGPAVVTHDAGSPDPIDEVFEAEPQAPTLDIQSAMLDLFQSGLRFGSIRTVADRGGWMDMHGVVESNAPMVQEPFGDNSPTAKAIRANSGWGLWSNPESDHRDWSPVIIGHLIDGWERLTDDEGNSSPALVAKVEQFGHAHALAIAEFVHALAKPEFQHQQTAQVWWPNGDITTISSLKPAAEADRLSDTKYPTTVTTRVKLGDVWVPKQVDHTMTGQTACNWDRFEFPQQLARLELVTTSGTQYTRGLGVQLNGELVESYYVNRLFTSSSVRHEKDLHRPWNMTLWGERLWTRMMAKDDESLARIDARDLAHLLATLKGVGCAVALNDKGLAMLAGPEPEPTPEPEGTISTTEATGAEATTEEEPVLTTTMQYAKLALEEARKVGTVEGIHEGEGVILVKRDRPVFPHSPYVVWRFGGAGLVGGHYDLTELGAWMVFANRIGCELAEDDLVWHRQAKGSYRADSFKKTGGVAPAARAYLVTRSGDHEWSVLRAPQPTVDDPSPDTEAIDVDTLLSHAKDAATRDAIARITRSLYKGSVESLESYLGIKGLVKCPECGEYTSPGECSACGTRPQALEPSDTINLQQLAEQVDERPDQNHIGRMLAATIEANDGGEGYWDVKPYHVKLKSVFTQAPGYTDYLVFAPSTLDALFLVGSRRGGLEPGLVVDAKVDWMYDGSNVLCPLCGESMLHATEEDVPFTSWYRCKNPACVAQHEVLLTVTNDEHYDYYDEDGPGVYYSHAMGICPECGQREVMNTSVSSPNCATVGCSRALPLDEAGIDEDDLAISGVRPEDIGLAICDECGELLEDSDEAHVMLHDEDGEENEVRTLCETCREALGTTEAGDYVDPRIDGELHPGATVGVIVRNDEDPDANDAMAELLLEAREMGDDQLLARAYLPWPKPGIRQDEVYAARAVVRERLTSLHKKRDELNDAYAKLAALRADHPTYHLLITHEGSLGGYTTSLGFVEKLPFDLDIIEVSWVDEDRLDETDDAIVVSDGGATFWDQDGGAAYVNDEDEQAKDAFRQQAELARKPRS